MKGVTENQIFGVSELDLFRAATSIVSLLPEEDYTGELLRCHEVARVVGELLNLEVLDGRFEYGCEHSWCVITRVKCRGFSILDPYAIGRIPPVQLICVIPAVPNRYFPEGRRTDIREDVVAWLLEHLGAKNVRKQEGLTVQIPFCPKGIEIRREATDGHRAPDGWANDGGHALD